MSAAARVLGAVLAGGASRRMGRDKAGVLLDGVSLGARAVTTLRSVCDDVVVLGHGRGMPAELARVADAPGIDGPVAGIVALLRVLEANSIAVVLAVDMPFVKSAQVTALIGLVDRGASRAAQLRVGGRAEPLPCAIHASALGDVERTLRAGERSIAGLLDAIDCGAVDITDRAVIRNLNTLADFDDGAPPSGDR